MRAFPPDVVVLDRESLLHARLARGNKAPRLLLAKSYRLAADTFTPAVVTPELTNEAALAETIRRLRNESGRWDKVSLLLPDAWFRINIIEVPALPDRPNEALEVVRWSLKRTLPIAPETLRIAYEVVSRTPSLVRLLVLSGVEDTLARIEKAFTAAGIDVILMEPVGLNIWNAIIDKQQTTADRLFIHIRETDFTTGVFRGSQPLFIRSRNLSGERTLEQEIRLSATYLRDSVGTTTFESCYVAGNSVDQDVRNVIGAEFGAPVRIVAVRDFTEQSGADLPAFEAELTACTGVFTA